jgi:metal-sulfur cluster biosynthetic enzyme
LKEEEVTNMVTKKDIIAVLKTIPDPEINVSLWDLGLIYKITVRGSGKVSILMTLTSIGCPLFSTMEGLMKEKIGLIKGITSVDIELTFEPPWTMDKMSKTGKMELGMDI